MAKRPAFFVNQGKIINEMYSFEWYCGILVFWFCSIFKTKIYKKSAQCNYKSSLKR